MSRGLGDVYKRQQLHLGSIKDQTMSNIIKQLEQEQLKQNVPSFRPGDTLQVIL